MPRLPDYNDLGAVTPQSGRNIASYDGGEVYRAATQAGEVITKVAENSIQDLDKLDYAYAKSSLMRGRIEVESELQNDDDYTTYEKRYSEKLANIKLEAAKTIKTPKLRQLFELDADADILRGGIRIKELAKKKEVDYGQASLQETIKQNGEYLFKTTDEKSRESLLNATNEVISGALKRGYITPQQHQKIRSDFTEEYAINRIRSLPPEEQLKYLSPTAPQGGTKQIDLNSFKFAPEVTSAITSAATRHGVDIGLMMQIAKVESGGNPSAKNPKAGNTSAGLYQFNDVTARKYGLQNKFDAEQSAEAAARLLKDNAAALANKLGRDPTAGEIYFAHQQGVAGALALLASPDKNAIEVLTPIYKNARLARSAVVDNMGGANMTAGEFANKWISKFDNGGPVKTNTFVDYIPYEKRMVLINKAESLLAATLKEDISPIESAAKMGLKVPRENIESIAQRADVINQPEVAAKLRKFADVQDASSTFALQDLTHQAKTIQSLKSGIESGNTDDLALYEAYTQVYGNKVDMLKKDPWGFYSAHDVVDRPTAINIAEPQSAAEEIRRRRGDVEVVGKLEGGAYLLPLLTASEIDQLKEVYEKGTPQQAAAAIATIGSALNPQERRALMQVVAPKSPALGVALSVSPDVAEGILIGSKVKGEVTEAKTREAVNEKIQGMVFDPEVSEALHESIYNYYKRLALDAGDVAKEVDEDRLETAIESVMGKQVSINPARMAGFLPTFSETSKVFTYKDDNGQYVDDNRLEDILGGITDDRLKRLNGSLPHTSNKDYVTAEEILSRGEYRTFGDGLYTIHFPGLGGLLGEDNKPYTIDARKLEALQKQ